MRRGLIVTALLLGLPAIALAHVTVRPRESKAGAEERYTVRVPTEGKVATTSVDLEVPHGVTVSDVPTPTGATHEVKREGDRIVAITWTKEIKPGETAEFIFVARNPNEGSEIVWKVHQRYADGTASDWVNPVGQRGPAPVTKLLPGNAAASPTASDGGQPGFDAEATRIAAWLQGYDEAFNGKDLNRLATFYHPDVTIYEGGSINNGWADYRDHHLGPELKSFENLQFATANIRVHLLGRDARSAYVTSEYSLKARMKDRDVESGGLQTLVLIKADNDAWKIRHSHTSSRRRPAQPPADAGHGLTSQSPEIER